MLKSLAELQIGEITPKDFKSDIVSKRILNLQLSIHVSMKSIHNYGCTALDLENVDERYLLCGGKNGTLAIYDLMNPSGQLSYIHTVAAHIRPSIDTHVRAITRVQWYPFDTGLFTTSSKCRNVRVWDANRLTAVETLQLDAHINSHDMSIVASRHNLIAVAVCDPFIVLYDPKAGSATHRLQGHTRGVECVRWSPNSENLLASGGKDKKIYFWDVRYARGYLKCLGQQNGKKRDNIDCDAHNKPVQSLKFTDDGYFLVSQDSEKNLKLWDVALAKNTLVNYSPISRSQDNCDLPFSLEICSDSKEPVLFVPSKNNINMYDLHSGIRLKTLNGHFDTVLCCVLRSNQELYSGGTDANIFVWSPSEQNKRNHKYILYDSWSSDED